jgi:outer membrane protein insertion porin family
LYRFDGVSAKNLSPKPRLRESFLPRRFQHLQGKIYSPEKIDETYRELLRSGLFSNLRYNPAELPDHTVRLDFTFEEAKAREVGFTLGFGTYDGFKAGIRLADRNLFGNGRPLTLDADYSQRGLDAELMYFDPWFLDHPRLNMRAKLFSADRREKGYMKNEVGGRIELGWKAMPHLEVGAFAQASTVKITEPEIDPLLLGPTDYQFISIGITQTTDYRDNQIAPTRGWIFSTSIDVGTIDGQRAFTRSVGRFSYYRPLGKMQLALGARAGLIEPVDESIPIDIRFFNGGATSVRSFAERDLGPKDNDGHPLGGEFFTVFNVELTFPIAGGLQGAVFADAGNLRGHTELGIEDMRYALGVGLRYALPVGPIRLDYGINPDRREGEDFGAFHFSFGVAF